MKRLVSTKAVFAAMVIGLMAASCGDDAVEGTKPGWQEGGSTGNHKVVAKIIEKSSSEGTVVWDGHIGEISFSYDKQGRLACITYSYDSEDAVDKLEYLYEKNSVGISLTTWYNGIKDEEDWDEYRVTLNENGYAVSCVNSYNGENDGEVCMSSFECLYDSKDRLAKCVVDNGSYDTYSWKNGCLVRCVRTYSTYGSWSCGYAYGQVKNNTNVDLNYFFDKEGALSEDMSFLGMAGLMGKRSEYMVRDYVNGNGCHVSLSYELDEDESVRKVNSVLDEGSQTLRYEYTIIYKQ